MRIRLLLDVCYLIAASLGDTRIVVIDIICGQRSVDLNVKCTVCAYRSGHFSIQKPIHIQPAGIEFQAYINRSSARDGSAQGTGHSIVGKSGFRLYVFYAV